MHFLRALALSGVLGISLFAAGCGGESGTATPPVPNTGSTPIRGTMSSPPSSSVTGQVDYMTFFSTSKEFQIKTSSGTYYWIATSASTNWTYNGLSLSVGKWVTAGGSWTTGTMLNASTVSLSPSAPSSTPSPAPPAGAPAHVQTAEYLESPTEMSTNPSVYAPYLTWAYVLNSRAGMTRATGIKTVLYTNPIMPNRGSYEYNTLSGSYPSARATTCGGSIVTTWAGAGLLSDPTKASTAAYFQNVVNNAIATVEAANPGYAHPWDLVYVDDDGPLYGASATPCGYLPSTWSVAQNAAFASTGQKFILNSLSVALNNVPTYVQRLSGSAIEGGEFEECFMTSLWASEEDAQLQTVALLKSEGKAPGAGFWCYADNTSALASSSIAERMYIYASFLLTYDPNYSVFEESFTTPSTFKVMPESGFVPMNPASVPVDVSSLQVGGGAYLQRYNNCYYRGASLGQCEIVVNPSTTNWVNVPNPAGLHHSMVLSGNGVLDGGSVTFTGAVPATMGPKSGVILTP